MQTKRLVGKHSDVVRHDRHSVKRWLPIEDGNVVVSKVAFHNETRFYSLGNFLTIHHKLQSDTLAVGSRDIECPRILFRAVSH